MGSVVDPVFVFLLGCSNKRDGIPLPKDVIRYVCKLINIHYNKHVVVNEPFAVLLTHSNLHAHWEKVNHDKEPRLIDINMMPIILGKDNRHTIPDPMRNDFHFLHVLQMCEHYLDKSCEGVVAYVTFQRSFVLKGNSQRRPGVHIDAPIIKCNDTSKFQDTSWGKSFFSTNGGIFLWTDQVQTCGVWNVGISDLSGLVEHNQNVKEGGVNLDFLKPTLDQIVCKQQPILRKNFEQTVFDKHQQRLKDYQEFFGQNPAELEAVYQPPNKKYRDIDDVKMERSIPFYETLVRCKTTLY